jgi:O-antigen ligase
VNVSNVLGSVEARAIEAGTGARSLEPARATATRSRILDQILFWLLVAALAWTPLWYGSNDLIAWGINAVLFCGLAAAYEVSLLVRRLGHPIGIRNLAVPAMCFTAVVVWAWIQTLGWSHVPLAHPIWSMAADALGVPIRASISVNPDLTTLALVRLITAGSVFWLALQLCRNAARASLFVHAVAVIVCLYAAYGLVTFASADWRLPWLDMPSTSGFLSSTFINRNSFATYAGLGLVVLAGLVLQVYRHSGAGTGGHWRLQIASLIETTGQGGALLLAGAFVVLVALLLTGSRGGVLSTGLGLFVLGLLTFWRGRKRSFGLLAAMALGTLLAAVTLVAFGESFVANLAARGVTDTGRMTIYLIAARSILDAPLLGYGYGTFADIFPLYRDRSISIQGAWEQAHDTYLEVFQGLGLVFGALLVACVVLLMVRCINGAMTRQDSIVVPSVAAAAAFLVGVHALADFSLQIQAVALTFAGVLGAGVAQSESSRVALHD